MNRPIVSVLTSVHNGAPFLPRAIESILKQTLFAFEFILIDDASTDTSLAIIRHWAQRDERIVPVVNETNLGLTRSLNRGIGLARGRYIARQDADDWSHPERLATQVRFLEAHPDIGLLGSAAWLVDPQEGREPRAVIPPLNHTELCWWILCLNPFFHSSVMVDRHLLQTHPYDESMRYGQDFELWGRLLQVTRGANLAEPLVSIHRHDDRISVKHAIQQRQLAHGVVHKHVRRWLPDACWDEETIRQVRRIMASPWPTPPESSRSWEDVLQLFHLFSRQDHLDRQVMATIERQLLKHLLLSLFSSPRLRPEWTLLQAMIRRHPRTLVELAWKYLIKSM
ncbi:MAG: glycosyltransferase family 2 protein [Magnetococcales bacterium]|nr:glycosyltransferase family 2 protein [Magnetococcales bacterium]